MAGSTPNEQLKSLGAFIRSQRKAAEMSLRELASMANVSNPYISQIERGLHEPSVRVLRSIANALNLPVDALLAQTNADGDPDSPSVEAAVAADPRLTPDQRASLLGVYRNFVALNGDAESA